MAIALQDPSLVGVATGCPEGYPVEGTLENFSGPVNSVAWAVEGAAGVGVAGRWALGRAARGRAAMAGQDRSGSSFVPSPSASTGLPARASIAISRSQKFPAHCLT
jgi:hypothetical protein